MSSEIQAYPLSWPPGWKRTSNRTRAKFGRQTTDRHTRSDGSSWTSTSKVKLTIADSRDRLHHELQLLGAKGVVISSNLRLKMDGQPMSGQREPDDPGICVYFRLDNKPRCLPCDRWDRAADNLAAIAKYVEALRGQLRWGVGTAEVAFAGFKALPGSGDAIIPPAPMTVEEAADALMRLTSGAFHFSQIRSSPDVFSNAYRAAVKRHHPDTRGGSITSEWSLLQRSSDALKKHHNIA